MKIGGGLEEEKKEKGASYSSQTRLFEVHELFLSLEEDWVKFVSL